jgi:hypothetical protein
MYKFMPNPRITQIIAELPFEKKLAGLGALVMIISLFFPWYQDTDTFLTGDTFTGFSGPMYFAGFTFLILAALSLTVLVMDYFDKQVPIFKVKTAKFHLWSGIASFYLLFLVGTVYFHPAFGINITQKESGFGMFMAYSAAALLTIGGYMEGRGRSAIKEFEKEAREPAINAVKQVQQAPIVEAKVVHPLIDQRKPRENIRNMQQQQSPVRLQTQQVPVRVQPQQSAQPVQARPQFQRQVPMTARTQQPQQTHAPVAARPQPQQQPSLDMEMNPTDVQAPAAAAARQPVQNAPQNVPQQDRSSQPFRMDL